MKHKFKYKRKNKHVQASGLALILLLSLILDLDLDPLAQTAQYGGGAWYLLIKSIYWFSLDPRLRGDDNTGENHPPCHSREGGNPGQTEVIMASVFVKQF